MTSVDELEEILPTKSACSELLSVALKIAPSMEPADGVASVSPGSVVPDFVDGVGRMIEMGFRMSPPFAFEMIAKASRAGHLPRFIGSRPPRPEPQPG